MNPWNSSRICPTPTSGEVEVSSGPAVGRYLSARLTESRPAVPGSPTSFWEDHRGAVNEVQRVLPRPAAQGPSLSLILPTLRIQHCPANAAACF